MGSRSSAAVLLALLLAACDNTPNAEFGKSPGNQGGATGGDAYALLESGKPSSTSYDQRSADDQHRYALDQSGAFRATYDKMLAQLDTDKSVDRTIALFKDCRTAFGAASAYRSEGTGKAAAVVAEKATSPLMACGNAAHNAAGDEPTLMLRFASAGLVIVGMTAVQGDAAAGLAIWREGERLAPDAGSIGPVETPTAS